MNFDPRRGLEPYRTWLEATRSWSDGALGSQRVLARAVRRSAEETRAVLAAAHAVGVQVTQLALALTDCCCSAPARPSLLAEIVGVRRQRVSPPEPAPAPTTAVDPICGMEILVTETTPRVEHGGATVYFCCEGCRSTFVADGVRHAGE